MAKEPPEDRTNETHATASGRNGPSPAFIAFVVVAAIIAVFFLRNSSETELDFLVFTWTTTIRWSIVVSILLGIALDRLFLAWWRHRRNRKTG
jgi:uncharacterized integral membrane protein